MARYLINLSGNICELLTILYFLQDRYHPKFKGKRFLLTCIALVAFQFANTNLFLSKSSLVFFGSFLFTFFVTLLYEIKWIHRLLFSFLLIVATGISEILVGSALSMALGITIADTQSNIFIFAFATLISKFTAYSFVLFTKRKIFTTGRHALNRNLSLVFILPIATFIIMLLFVSCCYQIDNSIFNAFSLASSAVMIIANIIVFYVISKQNELIETKAKLDFAQQQINSQLLHYQELYNYQSELRVFRHDIKNRLSSLLGLIKSNENEKAILLMEKNLNWLSEMNNNIINSGNPVIDAILQSKLHSAKEKGIEINFLIRFTDKINIDELDLGVILGNALDNAIEAVDKIEDAEKKKIHFKLVALKKAISISIENPVAQSVDPKHLFTTKQDKRLHGHGINSMRAIAEKYSGCVTFNCKDRVFFTDITMENEEI